VGVPVEPSVFGEVGGADVPRNSIRVSSRSSENPLFSYLRRRASSVAVRVHPY
jgi:hypothetical protein